MDSRRLIFDPSSARHGSVLLLSGSGTGGWRAAEESGGMKRRPFFTSGEEVWEEEYYELPEKKRRLTPEQVDLLEESFKTENKLEPDRKSELAKKLGMQPRQVAVWFQNRRARWKTKQLENDFDSLKASYDSLLEDHHSLLKDNDLLRSQVVLLTEKLQEKETAAGAEGTELKQNDQAPSAGDNKPLHSPSVGSGGSAVLGNGAPQLVDSSADSYFQDSYHGLDFVGNRIPSEEEDGSDDGCSYLPGVFEGHHQPEEVSQLGWWVWS